MRLVVVAGRELADFYNHVYGLLHGLYGHVLVGAMEVLATSEDVGAGQAHV